MTTHRAKKIIKQFLDINRLPYSKLTAKTIHFSDLLRTSYIFVTVHGWKANPSANEITKLAIENGFRVQFER